MMRRILSVQDSETGVGAFAVIVVVLAVAVIGLVAYRVKVVNQPIKSDSSVSIPKKIKTKADLKQADKALKALPISSDLNTDKLDQEVGSAQ